MLKPIADEKDEYIRILVKRNEQLQARLEKATEIYRRITKENKDLKEQLQELEEFIITLY